MSNDQDRRSREETSTSGYHVVITRNTEYHLKHGWCIAVVSRERSQVRANHPIVGRKLRGCVISKQNWHLVEEPVVGGILWFVEGSRDFLSSTIEAIQVPTGDDVPFAFDPASWVERDHSTPEQDPLAPAERMPSLPKRPGKDDAEQ